LLLYSSELALGVFQLAGHLLHTIKLSHIIITTPSTSFSGAVAREKEDFCKGSFRTHILYFVLSFAFILFLLASFYQKYKKIVHTIVVIFVGLLLSCFIMFSINGWLL
jgi:hypothetical protein